MTNQDRAWIDYGLRKELEALEGEQDATATKATKCFIYFRIKDIKEKLEELKCAPL